MVKFKGLLMVGLALFVLSGCQALENFELDIEEDVSGLSGMVQTYDENSQMIDRIKGNSVAFRANNAFTDDNSKGSVLDITVGGKQVVHVGSTLLFYENGLTNIFDEYSKMVDIENMDRATPIVNEMVNQFKSTYFGMDKVILIRSQSGRPLATFAGDKVSIEGMMNVDKMTKITIDGKRLYIYRADYTIYDIRLLTE